LAAFPHMLVERFKDREVTLNMRKPLLTSVLAVLAVTVLVAIAASTASAASGVCSTSTPQYCPAPVATTTAASSITTTSATLNGTANAQGAPTACTFAYGTTTTYSKSTTLQSIGSGTSSVAVTATITGLSANTPYHFELVCVNSADSFGVGGDKTFTTLSTTSTRSKVGFGSHSTTVSKKGVVKFKLTCAATGVACRGTLTLKHSGAKLANAVSYSIGSGGHKTISMKLTKKGLKKLKRAKHHKLKATAKATGSNGSSASKSVTLKLA
jgi:hypothetical protein